MHMVGLRGDKWCYITDGTEFYTAEEDVRYYSEPPRVCTNRNGTKTIGSSCGTNRIIKLNISMNDFLRLCERERVELRGKATRVEKLEKGLGPAAIGGGVGALLAGPVGATIGAGVCGWASSHSDFEAARLEEVFTRVREEHQEWERFRIEKQKIDAAAERALASRARAYESLARKSWERFHRLRDFSAIDKLSGTDFEDAIGLIYRENGYIVELTPASGDFGVDIIASKGREKLAIQAKRYSAKVGVKAVQEAASGGYYYRATKAIVISNSFYTRKAEELAQRLGVDLINRPRLALMWLSANPQFPTPAFTLERYKEKEREIREALRRIDFSEPAHKTKKYRRHIT